MKAAKKASKTKCAIKLQKKSKVLDPKIKAKWLKALRSGKYKQTRQGSLYNEKTDAYCCLGVLQHCISGPDGVESYCYPSDDWYYSNIDVSLADISPKSLGINAKKEHNSVQDVLASLNDNAKYNFSKIADWIEKYL